jgi:hypothetical protein
MLDCVKRPTTGETPGNVTARPNVRARTVAFLGADSTSIVAEPATGNVRADRPSVAR